MSEAMICMAGGIWNLSLPVGLGVGRGVRYVVVKRPSRICAKFIVSTAVFEYQCYLNIYTATLTSFL